MILKSVFPGEDTVLLYSLSLLLGGYYGMARFDVAMVSQAVARLLIGCCCYVIPGDCCCIPGGC